MGYKPEQFLKNVDENLFCSICHEIFQDPVSCIDGHTFCSECIELWLKTSRNCPLDNTAITDSKLVRNLIVCNIVDNLYVYCHPQESEQNIEIKADKNEELKCDWTGKVQALAKHRETCPFQQVQCLNVDCNTNMQRRELEDHDKICLFKMVFCDRCRIVLIRHELDKHHDSYCLETLIACPNNCTFIRDQVIRIKRIDLINHLTTTCAKTILDCPFKDQGCSVQVERQDVDKHVQDNMAAHMMLLAKQCSSLTKQNSSLTEQNTMLTKQCSSLASQCAFLTDRCSSLDQRNYELVRELDSIKSKVLKFVI